MGYEAMEMNFYFDTQAVDKQKRKSTCLADAKEVLLIMN